MKLLKFTRNKNGFKQLMKSDEMQAVLKQFGEEVQARAGKGYGTRVNVGKTRANVIIYAEDKDAYFRNLRTNVLLKALK